MKQIQIPEELFYNLIRYVMITDEEQEVPEELRKSIIDGLTEKMEKIVNREIFSKYKTAPTTEEREQARKKYLDSKGIPEEFRW